MNTSQRIADAYGVQEFNGLENGTEYHSGRVGQDFISLGELAARGGKVTRLRFLTSGNMGGGVRIWDVSYCHGELPDGSPVSINNGPVGIVGTKKAVMGELIDWAKSERVYAKGLGLLDQANWSVLHG